MMKWIRQWLVLVLMISIFLVVFNGCVQPGGGSGDDGAIIDIGAEYARIGPNIVIQTDVPGFTIFHPRQMNGKYPIITWGNGTEAPTNSYWGLLMHLASWGFVVIASDSEWTRSGNQMIMGVNYLLIQNRTPDSIFYRKLNPRRIGATGHSQGGGGAINTALDPRITCALPIAPARGDIEQVKCPIFLIAGSEDSIVPATLVLSTSYYMATAPTILGIAQGMGHYDFLGSFGKARGYITAWFMYKLKDDDVAAQAFVGDCEICDNPDWKVLKKNF